MLVPTPERLDMAKNECKYLAALQSPHIVRLYASKVEGEKVFMLMDFYDVRSLTVGMLVDAAVSEEPWLTSSHNIKRREPGLQRRNAR